MDDEYRTIKKLGSGSFGSVQLAKRVKKNENEYDHYFAVKILKKSTRSNLEEKFLNEVTIHQRLSHHPNIISYYGHSMRDQEFHLRMEYAPCGNLFEYLKIRVRFSEKEAVPILRQIFNGLQWIHSHDIVHRDIKLENILVMEESSLGLVVKIADFGLAAFETTENSLEKPCGTAPYAAPEIFLKIKYGKAVDIWSSGVLTYAMLSNSFPFNNDHKTKERVLRRECPFPSRYWSEISLLGIDFVKGILRKSVFDRPTIKEILRHAWLHTTQDDSATDVETRSLEESLSSNSSDSSESEEDIPLFLPQKLLRY